MHVRRWITEMGAIMAIARDELVEGGRCFLQTRLSYGSGAAVAMKLKPAKVLKVERAAAVIQTLADMRTLTVPFNQLVADEQWLDERDRKEELKRKRIEQERIESERAAHSQPPTLTHTMAEQLRAMVEGTDCDSDDGMPLTQADHAKLEAMRQDALARINALKQDALRPVEAPAPKLATVHALPITVASSSAQIAACAAELEPKPKTPEPHPDAPDPIPQEPDDGDEPEPDDAPEAEPAEPAQAPPAAAVAPAAPEPQLDPTAMLLRRIQGEFEQLIASEARAEQRRALTERLIERLTARQAADAAALEANRARQVVLSAQERQVLALAKLRASAPAAGKAPEPKPAQPPAVDMPIAAPERALDAAEAPQELLRAHDFRKWRKDPVSRQQKPAAKPAVSAAAVAEGQWSASSAPGWLRRRPGSIAATVTHVPRAQEIAPLRKRGRPRGPGKVDMSDPLERAIEEIAQRKASRA